MLVHLLGAGYPALVSPDCRTQRVFCAISRPDAQEAIAHLLKADL